MSCTQWGLRAVTAPSVVIRMSPPACEYQSAPSGPAAIPYGPTLNPIVGYSVIAPAGVVRPTLSFDSVNHSAPSEPVTMLVATLSFVGSGYCAVTFPSVVIRPMPFREVNHSAPSGPCVIEPGWSDEVGYSVIAPAVVIRAILAPSVNQSAPSGPLMI